MSDSVLPCDVRERRSGSKCVIPLRRVSVSWGSVKRPTLCSVRSIQLVGRSGGVISNLTLQLSPQLITIGLMIVYGAILHRICARVGHAEL